MERRVITRHGLNPAPRWWPGWVAPVAKVRPPPPNAGNEVPPPSNPSGLLSRMLNDLNPTKAPMKAQFRELLDQQARSSKNQGGKEEGGGGRDQWSPGKSHKRARYAK